MKRTELLQEVLKVRFEDAFEGRSAGRLTQEDAARILGVCDRTFRRFTARYEVEGLAGWIHRRLNQISNRRAPADDVLTLTEGYRQRHRGWHVRHFMKNMVRKSLCARAMMERL